MVSFAYLNTELKNDFEIRQLKLLLGPEVDFPGQSHVGGLDGGGIFLHHGTQNAAPDHLHLHVASANELLDFGQDLSSVLSQVLDALSFDDDGHDLDDSLPHK